MSACRSTDWHGQTFGHGRENLGGAATQRILLCAALALAANAARADVVVDFAPSDAQTPQQLGLSARATFDVTDTTLTILLENTSDVYQRLLQPSVRRRTDTLVTSLGFQLPEGTTVVSGDSAVLGGRSTGVGRWGDMRNDGRRLEREWTWTNDGGADRLSPFDQVVTTLSRHDVGESWRFDGSPAGRVRRSWGGIAPLGARVTGQQRAVSNSILFTMTLSGPLDDSDLWSAARNSLVEFGAGGSFLEPQSIPAPGALLLSGLGASCAAGLRRRRA